MDILIAFISNHWGMISFIIFYLLNLIIGHKTKIDSWLGKHPKICGYLVIVRGFLPVDIWTILTGVKLIIKGTLPERAKPIADVLDNNK